MSEQPLAGASSEVVGAGLHALAVFLRQATPLDAAAQQELAGLLDELGQALASPSVSAEQVNRLTQHAARFTRAAGQPPRTGPRPRLQDRVEAALLGLEARAPVAAGAVHRFLEALTNIGI